MSTATRFAAFGAVLALAFGAAVAAGGAVDPDRGTSASTLTGEPPVTTGAGEPPSAHADDASTTSSHGGTAEGEHGAPQQAVRGLAVADGGLRLVVDDADLQRGRNERLSFRIVDREGRTVRDFDIAHTKRMHLIIARRDLTGFQHLHPRQTPSGDWTTDVRVDQPGSLRLFADFERSGRAMTLASDLRVAGDADLRPLPAPSSRATSDRGLDVTLERRGDELRFAISRDGRRVATEPYLGAGGHLVALREGDLAFLHVHPSEHGDRGTVDFEAEFPTAGRYRLFLQFQHDGRVDTVAFTQEVK